MGIIIMHVNFAESIIWISSHVMFCFTYLLQCRWRESLQLTPPLHSSPEPPSAESKLQPSLLPALSILPQWETQSQLQGENKHFNATVAAPQGQGWGWGHCPYALSQPLESWLSISSHMQSWCHADSQSSSVMTSRLVRVTISTLESWLARLICRDSSLSTVASSRILTSMPWSRKEPGPKVRLLPSKLWPTTNTIITLWESKKWSVY